MPEKVENKEEKGLVPISDSMKNNQQTVVKGKIGGARPGAGRPKGSVSEVTKVRNEAKKELQRRIAKNASRLLNSQLKLAEGITYLFRIDKDSKGKKLRPVLVTDQGEIQDYLDGEFEGSDESYYYITTERPDNRAIDSMLDRAFGKADASVDLTSDGQPIVPVQIFKLTDDEDEDKPETGRTSPDGQGQQEDGGQRNLPAGTGGDQ